MINVWLCILALIWELYRAQDIRQQLSNFWQAQPKSFSRFVHLERVLLELVQKHGNTFRGVLFVEQRLTTHILQHIVEGNSEFAASLRSVVD